jgi:hypothetical protein
MMLHQDASLRGPVNEGLLDCCYLQGSHHYLEDCHFVLVNGHDFGGRGVGDRESRKNVVLVKENEVGVRQQQQFVGLLAQKVVPIVQPKSVIHDISYNMLWSPHSMYPGTHTSHKSSKCLFVFLPMIRMNTDRIDIPIRIPQTL